MLLAYAVLALLLANKPTTSELLNGSLLTICCTHFLRRHNIWTYAGFGLVSVLMLVRNKNNLLNQSMHWDVRLLGPLLTFQVRGGRKSWEMKLRIPQGAGQRCECELVLPDALPNPRQSLSHFSAALLRRCNSHQKSQTTGAKRSASHIL